MSFCSLLHGLQQGASLLAFLYQNQISSQAFAIVTNLDPTTKLLKTYIYKLRQTDRQTHTIHQSTHASISIHSSTSLHIYIVQTIYKHSKLTRRPDMLTDRCQPTGIFVCLFSCFTSQVNSYGHGGTVSLPNHTYSWASLNKRLTSTSCTYFRL